jgi:hydrogenase maturation protease
MSERSGKCSVGVIGIGNLLLKDEGVGVHALRALQRAHGSNGVRFIDGGTDPWQAISRAEGCEDLLVLDAVLGDREAGAFYRLNLEQVESSPAGLSLHGVTLFHLIHYERLTGNGFRRIRVLGMEPASMEPHIGLSEVCRERLPAFVEMVKDEIQKMQSCATA